MAQRYARIDVDFMHKRTANTLLEKFGPAGPLVFLALILRAKDGSPPGTFTYPTEALGWDRLGLPDLDVGFTLDEFFTATGRIKQTSRRRNGRVWNVYLTRYADWQKDAKRYEEATKKARTRAHSTGDTNGTQPGTTKGQKGRPRSRSRSTPLPPRKNGTSPRSRGTNPRAHPAYPCPHCGARQRTQGELDDHIKYLHNQPTA